MFIQLAYIAAALFFILGLKMLGSKDTARRGNLLSSLGMLIAVVVTLFSESIISYQWIAVGLVAGAVIGAFSARLVAMTAMPEMVALFNGSGGLSSMLVALAVLFGGTERSVMTDTALVLAAAIGSVTFSGSLLAWAKLSGAVTGRPVLFAGQRMVNSFVPVLILVFGAFFLFPELIIVSDLTSTHYFVMVAALSVVAGFMIVLPIGGADMPVVISLLNSMSGLAAGAAGIAIGNSVLIVSGALVGASGIILTSIMSRAMNRSVANILFGGFGAAVVSTDQGGIHRGEVKPITVHDAFLVLEAARSVVIIPGYGMAVSQAQHAVKELTDLLEMNGTEVRFAIHPVAGRMPGHMNVLLAEADVPYEQLIEMDGINAGMHTVDVAIVIGANDVVNPSAISEPSSPLYGMPIIHAERAKTVFVLKRSMNPGFSGVENSLFLNNNTRMIFGDARSTILKLVDEFRELS